MAWRSLSDVFRACVFRQHPCMVWRLGRLPNDRHDGDAEAGEGFLHLSPRSECGSVLNLDAMEGDGGGTGFCDYYAYDGEGPL